jgi:hypothetical protein
VACVSLPWCRKPRRLMKTLIRLMGMLRRMKFCKIRFELVSVSEVRSFSGVCSCSISHRD